MKFNLIECSNESEPDNTFKKKRSTQTKNNPKVKTIRTKSRFSVNYLCTGVRFNYTSKIVGS